MGEDVLVEHWVDLTGRSISVLRPKPTAHITRNSSPRSEHYSSPRPPRPAIDRVRSASAWARTGSPRGGSPATARRAGIDRGGTSRTARSLGVYGFMASA